MIQPITESVKLQNIINIASSIPVNTVNKTKNTISALQSNDVVKIKVTEDEAALEALAYLNSKESLRKPGFFSEPKISQEEALSRLKDKKEVYIKNSQVEKIADSMRSINDLFILDSLYGRKNDHHRAIAEIRLPLLFLEGKGFSKESNDENSPWPIKLDTYNAYKSLEDKDTIIIGKQYVSRKNLIDTGIANIPESLDPGKKLKQDVFAVDGSTWKVDGQQVNANVAYLAFLAGSTGITHNGFAIANTKDLSLLINLTKNQDNGAVPADLRKILFALDLKKISGLTGPVDLYGLYKALENGQKIFYDNNPVSSFNDLKIYDALEGSKQNTPLVDTNIQKALIYLNDGNLILNGQKTNAYKAFKAINEPGNTLTYTFNGGLTGEAITIKASDSASLITAYQEVLKQKDFDQFRPDIDLAKKVITEKSGPISDGIKTNLVKIQNDAKTAEADIPIQENNLKQANLDYQKTKPLWDKASNDVNQAKTKYNKTENDYRRQESDYYWAKDKLDRVTRDYENARWQYDNNTREVFRLEDAARKEDSLAVSDPNNAQSHKDKAAQYRQQANQARTWAQHYYSEMQRLYHDMEWARRDADRELYELRDAERNLNQAKSDLRIVENEFTRVDTQLNDASNRIRAAETKIAIDKKIITDSATITTLTGEMEKNLNTIINTTQSLNNYDDYTAKKDLIRTAYTNLETGAGSALYQKLFGSDVLGRIKIIGTIFGNMDKPAKP